MATEESLIELMTGEQREEQVDEEVTIMTKVLKDNTEMKEFEMRKMEIELEKQRLEFEKFKIDRELQHQLRLKELELELNRGTTKTEATTKIPVKLKLQPFNHDKEDVLTYLDEFESVSKQAGWEEDIKVLHLKSLLVGDAREIASHSSKTYEDLRKALITRFSKRRSDYFGMLSGIQRNHNETYRGLMARIDQYLARFIGERDTIQCFREEYFLKAWPGAQSQWIRRNQGTGTVVEAAEDYIVPQREQNRRSAGHIPMGSGGTNASKVVSQEMSRFAGEGKKNVVCFKCKARGHIARDCPSNKRQGGQNQASYLVRQTIGERLICVPGLADGQEISFVKDTGADVTLIREEFVKPSAILEGQCMTLYTAIGQPFQAKRAIVDLDLPCFKGHAQVGVVSDLAAEALLGMDILDRSVMAVTRAQSKQQEAEEHVVEREMEVTKVLPRNIMEERSEERLGVDELSTVNSEELSKLQREDESLSKIKAKSLSSAEEADEDDVAFYWEHDILRRKWRTGDGKTAGKQLVLPKSLRQAVIKLAHDRPLAGHLGQEKTKQRVLQSFYWPGMFSDIKSYCQTCDVCQKVARRDHQRAPMVIVPRVGQPFGKIAMDIVGPLPMTKSRNRFILTVVDDATRYPEAFPLPSIEAERIATKLMEMFSRVGIPKVILTDQGTNFTSKLLTYLYRNLGIKGIKTTPYHPQTNGTVERFNGTLKAMLKKLCGGNVEQWDELLPYTLFAYREVPHEETGFSPFELLYGWPVRGPLQALESIMTGEGDTPRSVVDHIVNIREKLQDVSQVVQNNLAERKAKVKVWYDKRATERSFSPGDEVLVLLPTENAKMLAHWKGPYRVTERVNNVNYKVNVGGRRGIVTYHVNLLKRYYRAMNIVSRVEGDDVGQEGKIFHPNDSEETVKDVNVNKNVGSDKVMELWALCADFEDVFTTRPGKATVVEHEIKTTSEIPITQRPYRIPYTQQADVKQQLDEMAEQGLIIPSKSPWSSPIVLVRKRDGTIRICVDYRKLNSITVFDAYPTPRIDNILEQLGNARYLSTLDLTKGYWQVPLSENSREKSAFITPFGLYEFTVMPFGMKTAPATFARLMTQLLQGLSHVLAYFDDIIIHSNSWEEHMQDVQAVMGRLREYGLTIRPSKCSLGQEEVRCLGHLVGGGKIQADPDKIKAMIEFPLPITKKQVRGFLGMTGYYRKFIKDFAELAAPLTDLTKKGAPTKVIWNEHATKAFKDLKSKMVSAPVLSMPNFEEQFVLQTDASDIAIGAVLTQKQASEEHPVAYLSRKLLPRERNYATIEKECLAIVWAIESMAHFVSGTNFVVETDHNPLVWLNQVRDKNQRLLRWALALQQYNFCVRYRKGKDNANADGLSRI
ncbi:uncharacterized protein LOC117326489 [Pecten maximus]|uniref:uncharacterized protein LOC117326489 n=1 Tax=Pecten maximus TaxID=6579 RepID=UPI0014586360|nr:uncharacterized protein LOC117326489 [Pecten maximus]